MTIAKVREYAIAIGKELDKRYEPKNSPTIQQDIAKELHENLIDWWTLGVLPVYAALIIAERLELIEKK
jgi:hypothetical protein